MNIEALQEIINNNVEILESSARDNGSDESAVVGIAKYVVANGYEALSSNQKYHFDKCIRYLIEDVPCPGYNHEFEEHPAECGNTIDDNDLVEFYRLDGKYCEACEAQASADAHSRESFFRD